MAVSGTIKEGGKKTLVNEIVEISGFFLRGSTSIDLESGDCGISQHSYISQTIRWIDDACPLRLVGRRRENSSQTPPKTILTSYNSSLISVVKIIIIQLVLAGIVEAFADSPVVARVLYVCLLSALISATD